MTDTPKNGDSLTSRNIDSNNRSLLSFHYEGKFAEICVEDGIIVYKGNLPMNVSAKMLFDHFCVLSAAAGFGKFIKPE